MRVRSHLATLLIAQVVLFAAGTNSNADNYAVDPAHSSVVFGIKHSDLNYVYGMFNEISGRFAVDESGDVDLTIATNSIYTGNGQRDNHLKSPDFFNVRQFPQITFKSSKITKAADGKYEVTGEVTLLGVTKLITATITTNTGRGRGGERGGLYATFPVNRGDFQLGQPGFLSDKVNVMVSLQGPKQ